MKTSSEEDFAPPDHPLRVPKTQEVFFEGQKYVLKRLRHIELLESQKEAKAWSQEEGLSEKDAANYIAMAKSIVHPKFTREDLRDGDVVVVNFLNQAVNDLTFLRLQRENISVGPSSSNDRQRSQEEDLQTPTE